MKKINIEFIISSILIILAFLAGLMINIEKIISK